MAKVTTLENLCFECIVMEYYRTEDLSLLPKKYRVKALLQLPIVDVCRLENTQFTADIAMDAIWEQLYEKYIGSTADIVPEENWKHSLLEKLATIILNCQRPYGYFLNNYQYGFGTIYDDSPIGHPADIVNYLIAKKCDFSHAIEQNPPPIATYNRDNIDHKVMTCYQVTVTKGVVPPGKTYQEGIEANQIIPSRHVTLLNDKRRFLPNLTALELIRKCGFCFKSINISWNNFGTFLLHAQRERVDFLEFLRTFFSGVESVTFCDYQDVIPHGVEIEEKIEDSAQELLEQCVETFVTGTLKSVSIVTNTAQPIVISVTPALTKLPSCLETFNYSVDLHLSDYYFHQLQLIIMHHKSTLRTITMEQVKYREPVCLTVLTPWLQILLASQSFQLLRVNVASVYFNDFLKTLGLFLSTPCSKKQTLSLNIVSAKFQRMPLSSSENLCLESLIKQLGEVDDGILQKKSIEYVDRVFFLPKFTPIRLGGLIGTRIHPSGCTPLYQKFIVSEIRFNSVDLGSSTYNEYKDFFKVDSLTNSIIFSECKNIIVPLLERAATAHGFTLEEIKKPDSKKLMYIAKKVNLYESIK